MRKSHTLLAVVMWFGSAQAQADTPRKLPCGRPACGNTMGKSSKPREPDLETVTAELAAAREQLRGYELAKNARVREFVTTPRRLASGAPACGNTMGKGPPDPCTEERAAAEQAERFADLQAAIRLHDTAQARVRELTRATTTARM